MPSQKKVRENGLEARTAMKLKRDRCAISKCREKIGARYARTGPGSSGGRELVQERTGRIFCESCWFAVSRTFSYTVTGSTILLGIGYAVAKWLWP